MTKAIFYTPLTLLVIILYSGAHITWNVSPSEPVGFYWITDAAPTRGKLVLLRNDLKRIAGWPGDTIRTTPEGSYVNGVFQPNSGIPAGSPYQPYPYGTFKLAPDQYWMLGNLSLSYDSRYTGPRPGCEIMSVVKPLWTKR